MTSHPRGMVDRLKVASILICGVVLAFGLRFGVQWLEHRQLEVVSEPTRGSIFEIEKIVLGIIFGAFAVFELIKLARVFTHQHKPELPDGRHIAILLVAFAGSLAVYLAYLWCMKQIDG